MSAITASGLIVLGLAGVLLGLIPATIARRKGRLFVGYWLFGIVLLPFALAVVLLLPEERRRPG